MKRFLVIGLLLMLAMAVTGQELSGDFATGVIIDPQLWYRTDHTAVAAAAVDVVVSLTVGEFNTASIAFDADVPGVMLHEVGLATDWGAMGELPIALSSNVGFDDELVGIFEVAVSPWVDVTLSGDWDPARYQYKLAVAKSLPLVEEVLACDLGIFYDTNGADTWEGIIGLNGGIAFTSVISANYDADAEITLYGPAGWTLENDLGVGWEFIGVIGEMNLNDIDGIAAVNVHLDLDPFEWGGLDAKVFMAPQEEKVLRAVDGSIYVKPDAVEWRVGYLWTFCGHVGLEYAPTLQEGGVYFATTVEY